MTQSHTPSVDTHQGPPLLTNLPTEGSMAQPQPLTHPSLSQSHAQPHSQSPPTPRAHLEPDHELTPAYEDWGEDIQEVLDHRSYTQLPWADPQEILSLETQCPAVALNKKVRQLGYPNRWGARIPIKTEWNVELLDNLLQGYPDIEITEWMRYGWPIGRLPTMPDPHITFKNHKGATDFPEALKKYINKEASHQAIIGPFSSIPFTNKVGISPLSTRPKKDSDDRRIILDLSFPPGHSVNDGILKDNYLGFTAKLTFPKTDQFAERIFLLGQGALMYKVDLHRYFRQLNLDPGDYSLVGYMVNGELYFDTTVPMGVRSGPYIAQRVSTAIAWIVQQLEYFLLNYVDDFVGAALAQRAREAFQFFTKLLRDLKIQTSPEKVMPPTTRLEFLGTTFDSITMTMEVPPAKLAEIKLELQRWSSLSKASRRDIESLIGKLQFAARCIRPGRIFIARMINWLKATSRQGTYPITSELRKDITWWKDFMEQYNGVSIMWLQATPRDTELMATDANLTGYGGISGQEYFKGTFPTHLKGKNIAILELWAVLIGLKVWSTRFTGKYFWIHVDNEAVATILNTGASKDEHLQTLLREIAYIAATHQFVIKAKHISGVSNRIPDWLSRWSNGSDRKKFKQYAREKSLKHIKTSHNMFTLNQKW